eukprot:m.225605 g.225605  ORF g.225605 m.225605 type:complete len:438 (+) comp11292_c0_seq1:108-1421(+)
MSAAKDNKKPTLAGQRIRSRKRDEKVKFEPEAFRDEILKGLAPEAKPADAPAAAAAAAELPAAAKFQPDFEKAYKFLDGLGNTQDYHKYAECLFDILISGGLLAPGGEVQGEICPLSLFQLEEAEDNIKGFANLLNKLIRRYKYLQVSLEEEIHKVLKFLKTFSPENRAKLARFVAALLSLSLISVKQLESLSTDIPLKEGISLEFFARLVRAWLVDTPMASIAPLLRKEKMDVLDFCPPAKRSAEYFRTFCTEMGGLDDLVAWQASLHTRDVQRMLQKEIAELLSAETPVPQAIERIKAFVEKAPMPEVDVIERLFSAVMDAVEWNKKPDLIADQALRHIKTNAPLLGAFATTEPAQVALMVRMQNYCYDNQNFLKLYNKLVVLLYKADVLTEDAILNWYAKGHSPKGRTVFLEQMAEMVEWLKNAEEESSEGEDD